MSTVHDEISALKESLRLAELGPDPKFFDEVLADDAVVVSQDGVFMKPTSRGRVRSSLVSR
jgi:hypothetical protein